MESALLRMLSASLDDDLVLWCHVDGSGATLIAEVTDPIPEAQVVADRLRGARIESPAVLTAYVARQGEPLFVPALDLADHPIERFPAPWPDYLTTYPVYGVIAVPVDLGEGTTGVLVAARRAPGSPYAHEHLALVRACAARLSGAAPSRAAVEPGGPARSALSRRLRGLREPARARELLLGAGLPLAITAVLGPFDDAARLRPAVLLLLGCVIAAVLGGFRAALLAAAISTLALWWAFTPPYDSWLIESGGDALGVLLYLATVLGVVNLVQRLDDARAEERLERALSDTVLNESPAAMAVFDAALRFRRVNRPMADLHGCELEEMAGMSPDEVHLLAGQLYVHLLEGVLATGEPLHDRELSAVRPEVGVERHWRLSAEVLSGPDREVLGVIASVLDVSAEVIARRRAERLQALSEHLTASSADVDVAEDVATFLVQAYRGRSIVWLRDATARAASTVVSLGGFAEAVAVEWRRAPLDAPQFAPLIDALEQDRVVVLPTPSTFAARFPEAEGARTPAWDGASLTAPIRDAATGRVRGVLHVGWPHARPITHQSITLLSTAASLVSLAVARIEATRAAHEDEFRLALDAMLDDVVILRSPPRADEAASGFSVSYANGRDVVAARRVVATLGGACEEVVATGRPYQSERMRYEHVEDDGRLIVGYWSVQIVPFGDGCMAISRDVTDVVVAEEQAREAARRAELERTSIELLQAAALPAALPDLTAVRVAAVYEPADARQPIGGDWYDVFTLDDRRIALVIADVAGHGRGAAAFMVQVRNVFRALAVEHREPGDVLERANDVTTRLNEPGGPFVTCCYAVLDLEAKTLQWAQAGHFSPVLVRADAAAHYLPEAPGPPLAVFPNAQYLTSSISVASGDRVLLFTDGLVERRGEHLDVGLGRLVETARRHLQVDADEFCSMVAREVQERFDDLALVCLDVVEI